MTDTSPGTGPGLLVPEWVEGPSKKVPQTPFSVLVFLPRPTRSPAPVFRSGWNPSRTTSRTRREVRSPGEVRSSRRSGPGPTLTRRRDRRWSTPQSCRTREMVSPTLGATTPGGETVEPLRTHFRRKRSDSWSGREARRPIQESPMRVVDMPPTEESPCCDWALPKRASRDLGIGTLRG